MRRAAVVLGLVVVVAIVVFVVFRPGPSAITPSPSATSTAIAAASSPPITRSPSTTPSPSPSPSPSPAPSSSPSPTPSPTPDPTPTPAPITVTSPDGYSLTLPAGWLQIPVTGQDINALLGLLGRSQPQVANLIRAYLNASGATVSLVALDPAGAITGLPPSAIVLLQPTFGLSLDLAGGIVATAINQVPGVGSVERVKVALPAGDAIRLSYEVAASGSGQASNVRLVQYLFVRGNQGYLITFTTLAAQADRDGPIFDRIISSVTFP